MQEAGNVGQVEPREVQDEVSGTLRVNNGTKKIEFTRDGIRQMDYVSNLTKVLVFFGLLALMSIAVSLYYGGIIITGGIVFTIPAWFIAILLSDQLGKRRREDPNFSPSVTADVPYASISKAEMKGAILTIQRVGKPVKIKLRWEDKENVVAFLKQRIGSQLSVK